MAKSGTTKNRARQFEELEDAAPRDFDPEDDLPQFSERSGSESDEPTKDTNGREHYAHVEKSKLRRRDLTPLGPQYTGFRVSRTAIHDEDAGRNYDPFAQYTNGDGSISDDQSHDEEIDGTGEESEDFSAEEEEHNDTDVEANDGNMTDDSRMADEQSDTNASPATENATMDRAALQNLLHASQPSIAASIARATAADAAKGRAVQQQRRTFDTILNARIRLQAGLVAVNTLTAKPRLLSTRLNNSSEAQVMEEDHSAAIKAAEQAATKLWNTIQTLRDRLANNSPQSSSTVGSSRKRKRIDLTSNTSLATAWTSLQAQESPLRAHRRSVLQKWSLKTQSAAVQSGASSRGKLLNSGAAGAAARQSTILDVLDEHLSQPDRLVKRTRVPRSCAPTLAAAGVTDSPAIYDDADFYGVMLKELLEQRTALDAGQLGTAVSTDAASSAASAQWAALRRAKTKKVVDTKASKGRKLRYTVHEKLQNFMAPEDRRTWSERRIDELFGGLLGRKMRLAEGDEEDMEMNGGGDAELEGVDKEEEALRLFRS